MKPKIINGWIVTLAAFRPDDTTDEEWASITPQQRSDSCTFSDYRIRIEMVYGYNDSSIFGCTTLKYGHKDSMTVTGTVEEFDKLLIGERPRIEPRPFPDPPHDPNRT